jgi:hypothetical protein
MDTDGTYSGSYGAAQYDVDYSTVLAYIACPDGNWTDESGTCVERTSDMKDDNAVFKRSSAERHGFSIELNRKNGQHLTAYLSDQKCPEGQEMSPQGDCQAGQATTPAPICEDLLECVPLWVLLTVGVATLLVISSCCCSGCYTVGSSVESKGCVRRCFEMLFCLPCVMWSELEDYRRKFTEEEDLRSWRRSHAEIQQRMETEGDTVPIPNPVVSGSSTRRRSSG